MAKLDLSAPMAAAEATYLQQACGKLLCYARAAGGAMLHALSGLAPMQSNGTQQAAQAMLRFLSYAAALPGAEKICKASGMALAIGSDAACLAAPQARSRAGGFRYLGSKGSSLMSGSPASIAMLLHQQQKQK